MKFIMVDIGSTFIKAGLFDVGLKKQIEKTKYPTPPRKANHDRPARSEEHTSELQSPL